MFCHTINRFITKSYETETYENKKISSCSHNNKRYILTKGTKTKAYGGKS